MARAVDRIVEASVSEISRHFQDEIGCSLTASEVEQLENAIRPILLQAVVDSRNEPEGS